MTLLFPIRRMEEVINRWCSQKFQKKNSRQLENKLSGISFLGLRSSVALLELEPVKVKFTTRHKDKVHFAGAFEIRDWEGQLLVAIALWELCHMIDLGAILAEETDMDGVDRNRRVAADCNPVRSVFRKVHMLKFQCHIVADIGNGFLTHREHIAGNRIVFIGVYLAVSIV